MHNGSYKVTLLWISATALFFLLLPQLIESYYTYLLTTVGIYVIAVLGVNLLTGNTGQVTVGQAGFFAIGAYTSALMQMHLGTTLFTGMIAGGLIAAAVGLLLGLLALRISGAYLAIATLGFGFAISSIILNWGIFQGRTGIYLEKPVVLGVKLGDVGYYYLVLAVVAAFLILTASILKSGVGRAFRSIKNSEIAAQAMGVNLTFYKTMAFTISAFYAGVGGALFAYHTGYISAEIFDFWLSTLFLVATVIGGLGSILGSVLGAAYIVLVPYWLAEYKDFTFIFMGIVLLAVIVFAPEGIAGLIARIYRHVYLWSQHQQLRVKTRPE